MPVAFEPGEKGAVVFPPDAKRRSKHFFPGEGPCVMVSKEGNVYTVKQVKTQHVMTAH